MALELATPNPAYATIKKLLSDPVDLLLRPRGGWKRPDDLLGALAKEIATNKGERGAWDEQRRQQREAGKSMRRQLTVGDRAHKRRTHRSRQHVSE